MENAFFFIIISLFLCICDFFFGVMSFFLLSVCRGMECFVVRGETVKEEWSIYRKEKDVKHKHTRNMKVCTVC